MAYRASTGFHTRGENYLHTFLNAFVIITVSTSFPGSSPTRPLSRSRRREEEPGNEDHYLSLSEFIFSFSIFCIVAVATDARTIWPC